MATFRAAASGSAFATLVINKPSGTVAGDVLLAHISVSGASGPASVPSGWTQLDTRTVTYTDTWYAKVAGASEPTSYTWTSATSLLGSITAWSDTSGFGQHVSGIYSISANFVYKSLTLSNKATVVGMARVRNGAGAPPHIGPPSGWTERTWTNNSAFWGIAADDKLFNAGATGDSASIGTISVGDASSLAVELLPVPSVATLQSVATLTATGQVYHGTQTNLHSVATLSAAPSMDYKGQASLQSTARLTAQATGTHTLDFTIFDAYIETSDAFAGLFFFDDPSPSPQTFGPLARSNPTTVSRRLQPVRSDVGNNPAEIRPEFGDIFAQNDFSHGSGQTYFHELGRDPKRYYSSEGFDISEPGKLQHLHTLAPAVLDTDTGPMTQAAGLPFVAAGTVVKRGDGTFPGVWTDEDPTPGGGPHVALSLAAEGARLFAACGTSGVQLRTSAGVWQSYQPDGATDLDINYATVVAWLKDRLMVIGGTNSRSIWEVAADSTIFASPLDTLKEGWSFVSIGEAGGFIQACAVNFAAGQSIIYSYGTNAAATAIERKSQTPMPIGQLAQVVNGYIGTAFIGGGKVNSDGGYDPFLYRASTNALGELDYILIRQEEGSGAADLSVRAITPIGESILCSWSLGSVAKFGDSRDGIAIYDLGRDSFAHHLRRQGAGGANKVLDILPYKGHVLVAIESFGLFYEDLTTLVPEATLVTSLADWNNAGQKVWDQVEISHDALPAGDSVAVAYTTKSQAFADWMNALISAVPDSEGAVGRLGNTRSRVFALKIISTATATADQVFRSFSVRSHPSPPDPEYDLIRYVRLLSKDRKDEQGELVYQDPRALVKMLQSAVNSWVTFSESGFTWTAFLTDVGAVESAQPFYQSMAGESLEDAFIVQLALTGARA